MLNGSKRQNKSAKKAEKMTGRVKTFRGVISEGRKHLSHSTSHILCFSSVFMAWVRRRPAYK